MTPGEQIALGLAAAYAGGWLILVFLLSKLYEWNFPAPFWDFIEKVWFAIVIVVDKGITAIIRAIARAITFLSCLITGHFWNNGPMRNVVWGAYRRHCIRCGREEFRTA